jgi:probable F420-dependent oxidoreductase
MARDFRFGFGLHAAHRQSSVQDLARRAEDMGFDVLHVPDHLNALAPFPTLTIAAAATTTLRVGTFVLNAGFYKAALLGRDVEAMRDLTGGRLELGLGAGYVRREFEAAEIPFPTAGQRVDHLLHVTDYLRDRVPEVPLMIAGNGDRLLTIAAQRAQIIGLTGGDPATDAEDPLAERIDFVRRAAPERFDEIELNVAVTAMPIDDSGIPDLSITRRSLPELTDEQMLKTPGVLSGSTSDIADEIRRYRDVYGISYVIVQQPHTEAFAKVIAKLK